MNTQLLRAQIAVLQDATMDKNGNFCSAYDEGRFDALTAVDTLLDSLQEESVSDSLEEAAKNHAVERFRTTRDEFLAEKCKWSFKAGAQWQKEKIINKACDWLWEYTFDDNLIKNFRKSMED